MTEPAPVLLTGDLSADLFDAFRSADRVAWDIETSGLDWRTDRIATCQVHAPSVGTAIVRVGSQAPPRLSALLADPAVTKVFHHAPFDLAHMRARWGVQAANVACTKIAAKLLDPAGPPGSHSLMPLLRRHLGVEISKDQQVSDWLAPDLTPEQLRYAAADVLYLLPLLEKFERDLTDVGRLPWYRGCLQFLPLRVELEVLEIPDVFAGGPRPLSWSGKPMSAAPLPGLPARGPAGLPAPEADRMRLPRP